MRHRAAQHRPRFLDPLAGGNGSTDRSRIGGVATDRRIGGPEISAHFPYIFRTLSVVSAIFRTFPEIFLSYPHTVLKLWYKNRFVSRKPPHGGNKQGRSLVQYACRSVRASNGSTDRRIRLGRIRIADRRILEPSPPDSTSPDGPFGGTFN